MECYKNDILKLLIEKKKFSAITEYAKIIFPDKKENIVITEYAGEDIRLFKDNDVINILYPNNITPVQESSITKAISNGTIFDDADTVDNYAKYIELSNLPYNGMKNKGISTPKNLHIAISSVIGKRDENDDNFDIDDASIENGKNFLNDAIHYKEKNEGMRDVIDNYLGNHDPSDLPSPLRCHVRDIEKEIDSLDDISEEDCISDSDYEYLDMDEDIPIRDEEGNISDDTEDNSDLKEDKPSRGEIDEFYSRLKEELKKDDCFGEGFISKRPKKLKPIPRDIISYITVEINAIQDTNDQAMLSGYTCSKLELVDFYLNAIDTRDERYIVPHTRDYLVNMQNELNRLLTQILRIRPVNKTDRVWRVNVTYPEGWNG